MANPTMTLIASHTTASGGESNFTFSSIPNTYTDLVVKISARATSNPYSEGFIWYELGINGSGSYTNIISIQLTSNLASSVGSTNNNSQSLFMPTTNVTGNFSNAEIYFSNYANSSNKSISIDSANAINDGSGFNAALGITSMLWSQTSAISSLTFYARSGSGTSFTQYSTFYLYGISNS